MLCTCLLLQYEGEPRIRRKMVADGGSVRGKETVRGGVGEGSCAQTADAPMPMPSGLRTDRTRDIGGYLCRCVLRSPVAEREKRRVYYGGTVLGCC
jgi:hypothetical protein